MRSEDLTPFHITEARYGVYEGGPYVLVAGVADPRDTDAFASDIPCMEFWQRVEEEGPVLEIDLPANRIEDDTLVYVASGSHPAVLFEEYEQYKRDVDRVHDNKIVNETFADYPDLHDVALDGDDVARHMLAAAASTRPKTTFARVHWRITDRVLRERFPGETREFSDLDRGEQREVYEFVKENEERNPSLGYAGRIKSENNESDEE